MNGNRFVNDLLDLCEEQGFRFERSMGGTSVKIFPKNSEMSIVSVALHNNAREESNVKARLRRIGLRFPIDDERDRRNLKKVKIAMAEHPKTNGQHSPLPAPLSPSNPSNAFATMREFLDAAINALGNLEQAMLAAEAEAKPLQALKDLLRQTL